MARQRVTRHEYEALASLRSLIRRFVHFSEQAAGDAGVEPQQHQLMLMLRAQPAGTSVSVRQIADELLIQQHSAVELIDRAEGRGLVRRRRSEIDRRQVFVELTEEGETILGMLSRAHRAELRSAAPLLIRSLQELLEGTVE